MQNMTGFSRQMAYARCYRHEGIMISTLRLLQIRYESQSFSVITNTGPTGQLHHDSMANGSHHFRPEDKDELDFSGPAMLFYARVNHLNDTE